MYRLDDVIAAPATAPGNAGVGIIRVSGPGAFALADAVFKRNGCEELETHRIYHGSILDRKSGEHLDDALLLTFRGPSSYTGQDTIEVSCHGGSVTMRRVLDLCLQNGARMAEPGEFTQRAFLNGKLDLSQAEAVADIVNARTEAQQRAALRQLEGALSARVGTLADRLFELLAHLEATIDFSDDIGEVDSQLILRDVESLLADVEKLLEGSAEGRIVRDGLRVAIVGPPNVGKSSLLNALLGFDRAIVTSIAGTTRDVVEDTVDICGIPVVLSDTAGIRATSDEVEALGVSRSYRSVGTADVVLFVFDVEVELTQDALGLWAELTSDRCLCVANKVDLLGAGAVDGTLDRFRSECLTGIELLGVSATRGDGLDELRDAIVRAALGGATISGSAVVSNARHIEALRQAAVSLRHAVDSLDREASADVVSLDLRGALDALGLISGATVTDDIIERIFSEFCIGK